jgi:hypothetical protein
MVKVLYTLILLGWLIYSIVIMRHSKKQGLALDTYQKTVFGYVVFSIVVLIFISYLVYMR